jgi:hypothetical protein
VNEIFNVYCDESCHLENDGLKVMVLGAVWCPKDTVHDIADGIRKLKLRHGLSQYFEVKWTKISVAKAQFYLDLVDYFFACEDLHFRGLLIPDKGKLRHYLHNQTHDEWYYKMYFTMLKQILCPHDRYRIYLDIKDTLGGQKIAKLHDVLCNNMYDFSHSIIERLQLVRSHEVEQMQLCDLLMGSIAYLNRGLTTSTAKTQIVRRIQEKSGYDLARSTLLREIKFNLFRWLPVENLQ